MRKVYKVFSAKYIMVTKTAQKKAREEEDKDCLYDIVVYGEDIISNDFKLFCMRKENKVHLKSFVDVLRDYEKYKRTTEKLRDYEKYARLENE